MQITIENPIEKSYMVSGTCSGNNIKELQRFILRHCIGAFDTGLMFMVNAPSKHFVTGWFSSDFTFLVNGDPSYKFLYELSKICESEHFDIEKFKQEDK